VNFGPLDEGRYQARVSGAKEDDPSARIVFDVRRYDQEDVDLEARPDLMARIAADGGGAVLSSSDAGAELRRILRMRWRDRIRRRLSDQAPGIIGGC